jgi:hypothetical protein
LPLKFRTPPFNHQLPITFSPIAINLDLPAELAASFGITITV